MKMLERNKRRENRVFYFIAKKKKKALTKRKTNVTFLVAKFPVIGSLCWLNIKTQSKRDKVEG